MTGVLAALLVAGCSTPSTPADPAATAVGATQTASSVPSPTPEPSPAAIEVQPGQGVVDVRPDTIVVVTAAHGRLTDVTVTGVAGGQPLTLTGNLAPNGASWVAPPGGLVPGATYTVAATAVGEDRATVQTTSTFATLDPAKPLTTEVVPLSGETVGVGMPIQVTLSQPVAPQMRAAVQQRLKVTTSVPVEGAWRWVSDRQVTWRPRDYWPANTQVSLGIALAGVDAGAEVWGVENRTVSFTVGGSVVSTVDIAAHQMSVVINGALARTIPVSTGKPGFLTRGGTKLVMALLPSVRMNAESIGIPPGDPEYYDLDDVRYAMRLTSSGEYIHAAPWSAGYHGRANVSHGCTGMSTANAEWLYAQSHRGDPVQYVNAGRGAAEPGNGWTEWNVPWEHWVAPVS